MIKHWDSKERKFFNKYVMGKMAMENRYCSQINSKISSQKL